MPKIARILAHAVRLAEDLFDEPGQGKAKKEWVVDFVNNKVDIPGLNEKMEERMLRVLVDVVVSLVVHGAKTL